MNGDRARGWRPRIPETNKEYPGVRVQTFNERFNGGNDPAGLPRDDGRGRRSCC